MSTIKIDGKTIPFEPGDTVIRAAWRQGIEIPHYCWHPGLSIAANCRMCLVEVTSGRRMDMPVLRWDESKKDYVQDTKPKLQPACQMAAQEGMEVSTQSEDVKQAQSSVQEFLLLNHPVDCPICDQAGECKLQDYWLDHQHELKRKATEPVHKPKGVRFGPTIVYDAERCIMCTRCIRVSEEVAGDPVLDMRERGNRNEIVLSPGRQLDHQYSLMTEHVCPVGALTSRDFRFKARVWFLKSAPGVCTGCATGCNMHVDYDPRHNQVYRLRPRDNLDINKFWMCDEGMMTYRRVHEGRVLSPLIGRGETRETLRMNEVLQVASDRLAGHDGARVAVVFSAEHSCEDNAVLAEFARSVLGTELWYVAANAGWEADQVLRSADNNPNRAGVAAVVGRDPAPLGSLLEDIGRRAVDGIVSLGSACGLTEGQLSPLVGLSSVLSLSANHGPLSHAANIVVPVASWAECSGTFVNATGHVQRFHRAIHPPAGVKPAWQTLVQLARQMGSELEVGDLRAVREQLLPGSPSGTSAEGARA